MAVKAPNFTLHDQRGNPFELKQKIAAAPHLLVFYPGGAIRPVCTRQFCDYRDNFEGFRPFGLHIVGICDDPISSLARFADENRYPFTFLSDPKNQVAKSYNCSSFFMMGHVSRAIFIINKGRLILYQYVEPTIFTRRGSQELIGILTDLQSHGLI